eukprot:1495854-Alexandrium_andersonii.AAC.1
MAKSQIIGHGCLAPRCFRVKRSRLKQSGSITAQHCLDLLLSVQAFQIYCFVAPVLSILDSGITASPWLLHRASTQFRISELLSLHSFARLFNSRIPRPA